MVETKGFRDDDLWVLKVVYGKTPGCTGRYLTGLFNSGREGAKDESGKDCEGGEATRGAFLETPSREIASFRKLAELHYAKEVEVTQPLMDSHLIPSQEDLRKIMDYEAALERQFESKLQQLVAWRRAKGEPGRSEDISTGI